jgi:hypothetical protein
MDAAAKVSYVLYGWGKGKKARRYINSKKRKKKINLIWLRGRLIN